jgi:hypothetical protein
MRLCSSSSSSSSDRCDEPLPEVLLLVSHDFPQWVEPGPARRYHRVMLTVRLADSVTTVTRIAAEYCYQHKHYHAVCLASSHGAETQPQLKWKHDGHVTLTASSVRAVAKITQRVHIITCWQGLFLNMINVPGVVLSGYNTWMNAYGKDQSGDPVEPEPWQLQYVCCGLPLDSVSHHFDEHEQSCSGMCRAEAGELVIRNIDSQLSVLQRDRVIV